MKTKIFLLSNLLLIALLTFNGFAQNVGINTTGAAPNDKALLDLDASPSNDKGLLVPRLTTAERNTIEAPIPESLLIYNTTTQCFEAWNGDAWVAFGCIGCDLPSAVMVSTSPNPICEGSNLSLTGSATDATSWSWTGPNGFTSIEQSPTITNITTAEAGVYTLTASNTCGSATAVSTALISVSETPSIAYAGADINPAGDATTATLDGNSPTTGTGTWTVVSGTATITTPSSPTSEVTGLAVPGTATLRWTISNPPCEDSYDDVVITTSTSFIPGCGTGTAIVDVVSSTGKTWMDRNLGASQQATSSTDYLAYGALFQWGRAADGHECITWTSSTNGTPQSDTTSTLATSDTPGHSDFITNSASPLDWRNPQNDSLWQGVDGINNPCPSGYRLPTEAEWNEEIASWSSPNAAGAFASPLKLPVAGRRYFHTGSLSLVGSHGYYLSSTVSGTSLQYLQVYNATTGSGGSRAYGYSVRCIKD